MPLREEFKLQGDFLFRHRSYLPLVIVVAGIYVYIQKEIAAQQNPQQPLKDTIELICFIVCLIGLAIRIYTIGYTPPKTSGRNTAEGQVADNINTTGLYSVCRHPLYWGNFLMWLGIAGFTQTFWFIIAFILLYWLYYERIMYAEEEFLRQKHGLTYLEWANKTPAWIPKWHNYTPPALPFNWRKVIRQEKSGILNLFLVIFVLKTSAAYITTGQWQTNHNYWLIGLIASCIYYTTIKILQKTTHLLVVDKNPQNVSLKDTD